MINLTRNKNICCGLKKFVAKSRAQVYFEQQILALLLVFHQTQNLSCNKFARALANQPISAPHFFKLTAPGEKRETSTKTCNETMLRDKLRVFVSRISPPLEDSSLQAGNKLLRQFLQSVCTFGALVVRASFCIHLKSEIENLKV